MVIVNDARRGFSNQPQARSAASVRINPRLTSPRGDTRLMSEKADRLFVEPDNRRDGEIGAERELRSHPTGAAVGIPVTFTHAGKHFSREPVAGSAVDALSSYKQARLHAGHRRVTNANVPAPVPPDIGPPAGRAVMYIEVNHNPCHHAIVAPICVFQTITGRSPDVQLAHGRIETNYFNHLFRI